MSEGKTCPNCGYCPTCGRKNETPQAAPFVVNGWRCSLCGQWVFGTFHACWTASPTYISSSDGKYTIETANESNTYSGLHHV